jgi:hypothetical protein
MALLLSGGTHATQAQTFDVAKFDRVRILKAANQYLKEAPISITSAHSPRSAGGPRDFFSEGDSQRLAAPSTTN